MSNKVAPEQQQMLDGSDAQLGSNGDGASIARMMKNKGQFEILYNVETHGCCNPSQCMCFGNCCYKHLKGRSYAVIGENYVEQNMAVPCYGLCCESCTKDFVSKTYMDRKPFKDGCCVGDWITEEDTNFCCYCIPTQSCYNMCCYPCYGGRVGRTCCKRGGCCYTCETRCCPICIPTIFSFVKDSKKTMQVLDATTKEFYKRQDAGGSGGVVARAAADLAS